MIEKLKIPFLNLRTVPDPERERFTREAMDAGEGLIYGGRIRSDDLLGEQDLLRKQSNGYVAGDIKAVPVLRELMRIPMANQRNIMRSNLPSIRKFWGFRCGEKLSGRSQHSTKVTWQRRSNPGKSDSYSCEKRQYD